ncbi:MAG: helix-hairpin-helix domain-containing protein [Candidatus Limnocylindrales bacterium]
MELPTPDWRALDDPPSGPGHGDPAAPTPGAMPRRWILAAGLAVAALALAGGALLAASAPQTRLVLETGPGAVATVGSSASPSLGASGAGPGPSPSPSASLVVDVEGAVQRPGVYSLPAGSRVTDAVAAAGGFGPRVDAAAARTTLNLAARLEDGDQIVVPGLDDRPAPAPGASPRAAASEPGLIDLNRATAEELDSLPGIGPVTSAKILAARAAQPFRSVDELLSRKLVSSSTFEKVRALITVGG